MALVLDGNGTMTVGNGDITGLVAGALPSNVIGSGAVLQVVQVQNNTYSATSNSSAYVAVGLSASITPFSSNSKILVMLDVMLNLGGARQDNNGMYGIYYAGSSSMLQIHRARLYDYGASGIYNTIARSMKYLHSPSTTSSCTYEFRVKAGTSGLGLNDDIGSEGTNSSTLTLMEIAG